MDRFAAIGTFIAVAEKGGFAAAARLTGQSTSAVTRHVAALEEHLGVLLFNRTTRAVSLTEPGERFLSRARKVMSDLQEAEAIAEAERGSPKGRIVVAAPEVFGRLHVAPLISEFMAQYPDIEAELLLANRMVSLVEEGVDAAIRIGNLRDSGDIARRLGAVRRVLVASPAYLKQRGAPREPEDLQGHRIISITALTPPRHWRFGSDEKARDVTVSPSFVTNSVDAGLWNALHGGGLTLALSYQVVDHVKRNELSIVMEDWEPAPYPVHFVYPSARLLSLKVSRLLEHIVATRKWDFLDCEFNDGICSKLAR